MRQRPSPRCPIDTWPALPIICPDAAWSWEFFGWVDAQTEVFKCKRNPGHTSQVHEKANAYDSYADEPKAECKYFRQSGRYYRG